MLNIDSLRKIAGIRDRSIHILFHAALGGAIAELRLPARLSAPIGRITQICRIGILHGGLIRASDSAKIREAAGYAEQISQKNGGKRNHHDQDNKEGDNSHIL